MARWARGSRNRAPVAVRPPPTRYRQLSLSEALTEQQARCRALRGTASSICPKPALNSKPVRCGGGVGDQKPSGRFLCDQPRLR